jgi:hypothetical protein
VTSESVQFGSIERNNKNFLGFDSLVNRMNRCGAALFGSSHVEMSTGIILKEADEDTDFCSNLHSTSGLKPSKHAGIHLDESPDAA